MIENAISIALGIGVWVVIWKIDKILDRAVTIYRRRKR